MNWHFDKVPVVKVRVGCSEVRKMGSCIQIYVNICTYTWTFERVVNGSVTGCQLTIP